jgi:hypothetical protein
VLDVFWVELDHFFLEKSGGVVLEKGEFDEEVVRMELGNGLFICF